MDIGLIAAGMALCFVPAVIAAVAGWAGYPFPRRPRSLFASYYFWSQPFVIGGVVLVLYGFGFLNGGE